MGTMLSLWGTDKLSPENLLLLDLLSVYVVSAS
jgi:hypothetical protein